ncbi:hypothetical protein TNCV_4136311 [Trichonephila clavipes]|nr:hypothetical protein TNCV_4136311 [Trichonephila clavipes]
MKSAVKPHQTVTLGCCKGTSTNACGFSVVHTRQLWVLTAPENVKYASSVQSQSCCSSILLNTKFTKSRRKSKSGGFSSWLCCNLCGCRRKAIRRALQTLPCDTPVCFETSRLQFTN